MAIPGYLEPLSKTAGRHRDARRKLRLQVQGSSENGTDIEVLIHNISATGLLIQSDSLQSVGEEIGISLPHSGVTWAKVIWTSGNLCGCQFAAPISPATLSAAQLRSIIVPDAGEIPDPRAAIDESFGDRLLRLRIEKGLTQAQVAEVLNVSEPSISAWEQDKSRPRAGRVDALAHLLGVEIGELMGHDKVESLYAVIRRAKQEIAKNAGTDPDLVKIIIEF